jgi:hypothetical protein
LISADHNDPAACGREYLCNTVADDAVANDCYRFKPTGIHSGLRDIVSSILLRNCAHRSAIHKIAGPLKFRLAQCRVIGKKLKRSSSCCALKHAGTQSAHLYGTGSIA